MSHLHVCLVASALALAGCSFGLDGDPEPALTAAATADAPAEATSESTAPPAAAPQGVTGQTVSDVSFGPGIGIENGRLVRTGSGTWSFSYDSNAQTFALVETDAGADYVALAQNGGLNLRIRIDLAANQVLLGNSAASDDTVFPIKSAS